VWWLEVELVHFLYWRRKPKTLGARWRVAGQTENAEQPIGVAVNGRVHPLPVRSALRCRGYRCPQPAANRSFPRGSQTRRKCNSQRSLRGTSL
jgi:hypothetical protein